MSKIEWTDKTWNPIVGCGKISKGCKNCYAEKMALRLANIKSTNYYSCVVRLGEWSNNIYFVESALNHPLKWKKPKKIFVCSMGDLFHESVGFQLINSVFTIMRMCPQHTFLLLTKRPLLMKKFIELYIDVHQNVLPNIWLGVTAEDQKTANERIQILSDIPAVKRFISCEPLLSNIYFDKKYLQGNKKIDWVIAGPETGHKSRPMQKYWLENIYNQCRISGIAFFDKKNVLGFNLKEFPE